MNSGYMEDLLDGYKEEMEWRLKWTNYNYLTLKGKMLEQ
jgi:hypothetical protein